MPRAKKDTPEVVIAADVNATPSPNSKGDRQGLKRWQTKPWGDEQTAILTAAICQLACETRPQLYRTPGLEAWNVNGGSPINNKLTQLLTRFAHANGVQAWRPPGKGSGKGGAAKRPAKSDIIFDDGEGGRDERGHGEPDAPPEKKAKVQKPAKAKPTPKRSAVKPTSKGAQEQVTPEVAANGEKSMVSRREKWGGGEVYQLVDSDREEEPSPPPPQLRKALLKIYGASVFRGLEQPGTEFSSDEDEVSPPPSPLRISSAAALEEDEEASREAVTTTPVSSRPRPTPTAVSARNAGDYHKV